MGAWAVSLLLCKNGHRKQSSGHVGPPFLTVKLFSHSVAIVGDHWPTAVTIASSLDSGCGLSHECAQDGCNGCNGISLCEVRSFKPT